MRRPLRADRRDLAHDRAVHATPPIRSARRRPGLRTIAGISTLLAALLVSGLPLIAPGTPAAPPSAGGIGGAANGHLSPPTIVERPVPGTAIPATPWPSTPDWPTFLGNDGRTSANLAESTLNLSNVANLSLRWSYLMNGTMFSSVAYVNGTAYFGSWNGYEYAVYATNGTLRWATYL